MNERRAFLQGLAGLGIALVLEPGLATAEARAPLTKPIPSTGERIPVIGVGSWLTFDAGAGAAALERLQPVLQAFFDHGGRLIDSSPMYGTAASCGRAWARGRAARKPSAAQAIRKRSVLMATGL